MLAAILFTLASVLTFFGVAYGASFIAKRHHYYEDPDEDAQGVHHNSHFDKHGRRLGGGYVEI